MSNKRFDSDELTLLFRRLFSTDDGKDALYVLNQMFRKKPLIPSNVGDGAALIPLTFTRIGEDNVVRFIESLIEREVSNGRAE